MITTERLEYLAALVADARKLSNYEGGPIQIFIEVIDQLRLDALALRDQNAELEQQKEALLSVMVRDKAFWDEDRARNEKLELSLTYTLDFLKYLIEGESQYYAGDKLMANGFSHAVELQEELLRLQGEILK